MKDQSNLASQSIRAEHHTHTRFILAILTILVVASGVVLAIILLNGNKSAPSSSVSPKVSVATPTPAVSSADSLESEVGKVTIPNFDKDLQTTQGDIDKL